MIHLKSSVQIVHLLNAVLTSLLGLRLPHFPKAVYKWQSKLTSQPPGKIGDETGMSMGRDTSYTRRGRLWNPPLPNQTNSCSEKLIRKVSRLLLATFHKISGPRIAPSTKRPSKFILQFWANIPAVSLKRITRRPPLAWHDRQVQVVEKFRRRHTKLFRKVVAQACMKTIYALAASICRRIVEFGGKKLHEASVGCDVRAHSLLFVPAESPESLNPFPRHLPLHRISHISLTNFLDRRW